MIPIKRKETLLLLLLFLLLNKKEHSHTLPIYLALSITTHQASYTIFLNNVRHADLTLFYSEVVLLFVYTSYIYQGNHY